VSVQVYRAIPLVINALSALRGIPLTTEYRGRAIIIIIIIMTPV